MYPQARPMSAPRADRATTTAALAAHAPAVICAPVARPKLKVMSVMNALSATRAVRRTRRITHGWMGVSAYMREMPVVRSTDSVAPREPPTRMTPYVVIIAIIAAARFPRPVWVVRATSVMPNIAYMNMGRSRANAMFHGLRMWDRKVARHSLPAPVKGKGIGRSVARAGAWVVMMPSSCVVSAFVGRGPWCWPRDEAGAGSSGWAFVALTRRRCGR